MNRNGCYNRPAPSPGYFAFDGYRDAARTLPKTVWVVHAFEPGCDYGASLPRDPRCVGCTWEKIK